MADLRYNNQFICLYVAGTAYGITKNFKARTDMSLRLPIETHCSLISKTVQPINRYAPEIFR